MANTHRPRVTASEKAELAENLGIDESATEEGLTLTTLRSAIETETETDPEFVSMAEDLRSDLTGDLDADLLERELERMATQFDRLEEVREVGIPGGDQEAAELYRELIAPGWNVYDHLASVGFFESAEENLPAFTPDHIERTAEELIATESVTSDLAEFGFDDEEQTVLLMNVANNNTRLSRWVPTRDIPEGVEFNVENVPPLHQRAMGGALLWVKALDHHLWQKEILITDEILDDAYWYTKAMLGGLYVLTRAAHAIAEGTESDLSDSQAMAALTAGAAMLIVNQEELMKDVFWITEEKRAPTTAR